MKRSIHVRENHDQADSSFVWLTVLLCALLLALILAAAAAAGTAYFSAQGWLAGETTTLYFDFDITSTLRPPSSFSLRTWHYGGGINAAGDTIPAGSFDPILELWGPGSLLIQNDDGPYGRDSLIDWATAGMPLQLASGNYGVRLFPYSGDGNWAADLVADATKFTLTGAGYFGPSPAGAGIWSLKLGSDDVRTPARLSIGYSEVLELYHYYVTGGQLVLGNTGSASALVLGELDTGHSILGFSPGSVGTLTITSGKWEDFGSYDATSVGFSGKGTLDVQAYGRALFDYNLMVARYPGSEGHVTVSGAGAYASVYGNLEIGVAGTGTLQIDNQGFVDSRLVGNTEEDVVASLSGSTGTVDVVGYNSRWDTDSLTVGKEGQGIVRITSGGQINTFGNAHIGKSANASASSVTVAGMSAQMTEASWLVSRDLHIAGTAAGPSAALNSSLSIAAGGFVDVNGATTVWNSGGSLNLLGGEMETESLFVKPGATFTHTDGTLTINGGSFDPGGIDYTIDGADAADLPTVQLANGARTALRGYPKVGVSHRGRLEILGGSRVDVPDPPEHLVTLIIGEHAGSEGEVVVDGQDATLTTDQGLVVAGEGHGTLRILNGGLVRDLASPYEPIGHLAGSSGSVEVTGADLSGTPSTYATNGQLRIGNSGRGTLEISAGGRVTASAGAAIACLPGADGSYVVVTGSASQWNVSSSLYVGGRQDTSGGSGKLTAANGGQVTAGSVKVWQPGTIELNNGIVSTGNLELAGGTLRGTGSLILMPPNALHNSGLVAPGLSAGVINIASGNYVQDPTGTLAIEIGGPNSSQYDHLRLVNGSATLAGRLVVSLIDPTGGSSAFMPSAGNAFDILDWTSRSGTFEALVLPTLASGLMWNASQLYTAGILSVFLAGDYNGNGVVDADDYVVWRDMLGQTGTGLAADGDGSRRIDDGDYTVWRAHFGQVAGSAASHTAQNASDAVPEPVSLTLLLAGVALLWIWTGHTTALSCHPARE